ncbi:MAG: DUF4105 domain-containing protein [Muribaculaceae bacterium]|nr:DUF4105 domain-containing protein [Muribaculaceae bacterium]
MRGFITLVGVFLTIFSTTFTVAAALNPTPGNADTVVEIVNFYPGQDIYELEGHTVLRIITPESDRAVSFGTFDFNQPNFVYRFVKGETDYWASEAPFGWFAEAYAQQGRRIVAHRINLTSAQKARLIYLTDSILRPENRVYRYNYVKDNCATRPLGLIEQAAGHQITPGKAPDGVDTQTFRSIMRYYHRAYPWYQFGIDIALGSGIDYQLNEHEKTFAPVVFDAQLPDATLGGSPLVTDSYVIYEGLPGGATEAPTPWYLTPMAVFTVLTLVILYVVFNDIRNKQITRWADTLMFSAYGLVGLLLTFLIFVSVHEATSPNYLYFWLNPLCLTVPALIWFRNGKIQTVLSVYEVLNLVSVIFMCVAWAFLGQSGNIAFIPLIIIDIALGARFLYVRRITK